MNYPSKRAYYENENDNNAKEPCYVDGHIGAIFIDDNETTTLETKLNNYDTLIGSDTLSTTSQTLKGAVNEVKAIADSNTTQLSEKANIANPVFTGTAVITGAIELGSTSTSETPYVDFHSSGNNIDFDARIVASGGNASVGQGTINVQSVNFQANGYNILRALSGGYKIQSGTISLSNLSANTQASANITFPVAFLNVTNMFFQIQGASNQQGYINIEYSNTALGATVYITSGVAQSAVNLEWIAIGS